MYNCKWPLDRGDDGESRLAERGDSTVLWHAKELISILKRIINGAYLTFDSNWLTAFTLWLLNCLDAPLERYYNTWLRPRLMIEEKTAW